MTIFNPLTYETFNIILKGSVEEPVAEGTIEIQGNLGETKDISIPVKNVEK